MRTLGESIKVSPYADLANTWVSYPIDGGYQYIFKYIPPVGHVFFPLSIRFGDVVNYYFKVKIYGDRKLILHPIRVNSAFKTGLDISGYIVKDSMKIFVLNSDVVGHYMSFFIDGYVVSKENINAFMGALYG